MLFPTLDYVLFLALVVVLYWVVPARYRLWVLTAASVAFYASWRVAYLPVLAAIVVVAWAGGLWMARLASQEAAGRPASRGALLVGLLLLPLIVFKYWNWLITDLFTVLGHTGLDVPPPTVSLELPLGISFFTFQTVAYVVDVRRTAAAEHSPVRFSTFVMFFPQLVAGPIVRRHELIPQLQALPLLRSGQVGAGLFRIGRGMVKKVLFADVLRVGIVDSLFADPGHFTGLELLIGLYAYTLQIYCDFSGYTDIAIGSARLFGIELPENFRRPYKATSVAGFWRRWHMTLSNWVRDYVYYPLGGSRVASQPRVYVNILITLLIIGVWHGASWSFVVYGLLHGSAVAINRYQRKRTGRRPDDPLPSRWAWAWRWCVTFHFIVLARILFRAPDFATAGAYAAHLLDPTWAIPRFAPTALAVLLIGYAIHFSPERWQTSLEERFAHSGPLLWAPALALVGIACMVLGTGRQLAFVYYQF